MAHAQHQSGSRLLRHLPAIYQDPAANPELESFARFLAALEAILFDGTDTQPGVAAIVEELPALLDPDETPELFLPWLASNVALALHPDLPAATQRALVLEAVPLYQRRGTRAGLERLLDIVTGGTARVVEPESAGFRVGGAVLGSTARIGRDRPHYFEVLIDIPAADGTAVTRMERVARAFIDRSKPAHTHYNLTIAAGAAPDREPLRYGVR